MAAQLQPDVEACDAGRVGTLQLDEHDVAERVGVEPALKIEGRRQASELVRVAMPSVRLSRISGRTEAAIPSVWALGALVSSLPAGFVQGNTGGYSRIEGVGVIDHGDPRNHIG